MYIKKTWRLGNVIEVEKCHTGRYGKKGMRHNKKTNPSPEAMKECNRQKAIDRLRRLILYNMPDGYHLTLTYRKNDRPDRLEAERQLKNFIRRLQYHIKKAGYELKYIPVTEYENKAIHHHLVINNVPGIIELVKEQWKCGQPNFTPLSEDGDIAVLAEYLIKETDKTFRDDPAVGLRYTHSRNMVMPEPEVKVIKANSFKEYPSVPKGYTLDVDSLVNGVSSVTGYEFQKYTLKKIQNIKQRR